MVSKTKSVKTAWLLLCLKVNNMEYKVSNPQTKEPGDGCVKPVYDFESSAWRLHNNGQQHGKYYIHFETVYFDYLINFSFLKFYSMFSCIKQVLQDKRCDSSTPTWSWFKELLCSPFCRVWTRLRRRPWRLSSAGWWGWCVAVWDAEGLCRHRCFSPLQGSSLSSHPDPHPHSYLLSNTTNIIIL